MRFEFLNGSTDEIFDEVYRALQIYPKSIPEEVGTRKWLEMAVLLMDFLDKEEIGNAFEKHIEKEMRRASLTA